MRSLLTPLDSDAVARRGDRVHLAEPPLLEVVKNTADDLVTLVTAEVKLARLEVVAGLRHAVDRAGWMAAGFTTLLVGYLGAVAALAAWLSTFWGWPGALAVTALSQGILGGCILWAMPAEITDSSRSPSSREPHG
jgi:putative superfamily III holin-X